MYILTIFFMKKLPVIVLIALVCVIAIVLFVMYKPVSGQSATAVASPVELAVQKVKKSVIKKGTTCPVIFTEYLVDPTLVQKVGQVGVLHGSGDYLVERSYISVKPNLIDEKIPLYAPADMMLTWGSHYKMSGAGADYLAEYALRFDAGCGIEVSLGHVKEVVEPIARQLPQVKPDSRETKLQPIRFKAGDLIGYYIQQKNGVAGFDFIVRDEHVTATFINQERYANDRARNLIHGVCPYDFYRGEKRDAYYGLLGGAGGTIFQTKDCGSASRDVAGTISGMWFLDKEIVGSIYDTYSDGDYASPITLVGDEEKIAIGNVGSDGKMWVDAKTNPTYMLPTSVRDEHCYQGYINPSMPRGYAYFRRIDDVTMDLYYSRSGTCPKHFPEGKGRRYFK